MFNSKTHNLFFWILLVVIFQVSVTVSAQDDVSSGPKFLTEAEEVFDSKLFRFAYNMYDKYRIKILNDQQISINNEIVEENAHIENNILVEIEERGLDSFLIDYSIETLEDGQLIDEEKSIFHQNSIGIMQIPDEYLVPYVRNIPQFPEYALKVGDKWEAVGQDYFIFPNSSAYTIDVLVQYQYMGIKTLPEGIYDKFNNTTTARLLKSPMIEASYTFRDLVFDEKLVPEKIPYARFQSKIWWNDKDNRIEYYQENFEINTQLGNKPPIKFEGQTEGIMIPASKIQRDLADNLKEELEEHLENVKVEKKEEGISISIENIGFEPNSSILKSSEKEKLEYLAGYLSNFKGRRVLVEGHTADFGTKEQQLELSKERAKAVVDALKEFNSDGAIDFLYRGKGATQPIDSNLSEQGRIRNRRVEITILEN